MLSREPILWQQRLESKLPTCSRDVRSLIIPCHPDPESVTDKQARDTCTGLAKVFKGLKAVEMNHANGERLLFFRALVDQGTSLQWLRLDHCQASELLWLLLQMRRLEVLTVSLANPPHKISAADWDAWSQTDALPLKSLEIHGPLQPLCTVVLVSKSPQLQRLQLIPSVTQDPEPELWKYLFESCTANCLQSVTMVSPPQGTVRSLLDRFGQTLVHLQLLSLHIEMEYELLNVLSKVPQIQSLVVQTDAQAPLDVFLLADEPWNCPALHRLEFRMDHSFRQVTDEARRTKNGRIRWSIGVRHGPGSLSK